LSDRNFAIFYSDRYLCHLGSHPFSTYKYKMIVECLIRDGVIDREDVEEPTKLSYEELNLVHTSEYLADLLDARKSPRTIASELPVSKDVIEAFWWNCSGSVRAAEFAFTNRKIGINIGGGFHHAFHHRAEGFCYINDVAISVKKLIKEYKAKKIAVIDLDLHQGNGTAFILQTERSVFTLSIHQEDTYPPKEKSSLDIGLYSGAGDEEYLQALKDAIVSLKKFSPKFAIYIAGVDIYEGDLLGGLSITREGIERRDDMVFSYLANAKIPFALVLAGGYTKDMNELVDIHCSTIKKAIRYSEYYA